MKNYHVAIAVAVLLTLVYYHETHLPITRADLSIDHERQFDLQQARYRKIAQEKDLEYEKSIQEKQRTYCTTHGPVNYQEWLICEQFTTPSNER